MTVAAGRAAATPGGVAVPTPATTTTTSTLPPLPQVAPSYTNGEPAQTLLSNAITLASLGLDNSALIKAVAATQAKLESAALDARKYSDEARAAQTREATAQDAAAKAGIQYASMAGAIKQAVVYLYTTGPAAMTVNPKAGAAALFAQDYAESTVGPYGVLARRQAVRADRAQALQVATREEQAAATASAKAAKALSDQQRELSQLKAELASVGGASAAAVASDHISLASQAGKELLNASSLEFKPQSPIPSPLSTTNVALTWAFAELGKEYIWGATGPDTFDCSGLTQFVWKAAGVSIPRVAADQDSWTIPVPLSQLLPGDLVFFGTTDIHHVGIYIGNGLMINAPHTGTVVQVSSIWWSDLAGFGRVHYPGTPIPPHTPPNTGQPAAVAVLPTAGPVPSQTKPPAGWTPQFGETTPIAVGGPVAIGGPAATTTTAPPAQIPSSTTTTTSSVPTTSAPTTPASNTTTTLPVAGDGSATTTTTTIPSTAAAQPAG